MHSTDHPNSQRSGLANVPTAAELDYVDSDLYTTKRDSQMELSRNTPAAADGAWLRIDPDSFVFDLEEWC